jgi:hypothetical protein
VLTATSVGISSSFTDGSLIGLTFSIVAHFGPLARILPLVPLEPELPSIHIESAIKLLLRLNSKLVIQREYNSNSHGRQRFKK